MTTEQALETPEESSVELVPEPVQQLPVAREDLTARAESWARGARADKTWAAYERQWARFEGWCAAVGERALPADPLTVARFLADLAPRWRPATPVDAPVTVVAGQVRERDGMRPGTLRGYLAAISVVHQTAQLENPTRSEAVRRTLAGIGRHPAVAPSRRRAAARRDPLLGLLRALRPEESLADARDHALLLIGWKAALRTDDLARLQMADLHASEQGLSVFIPRSKTDQAGHGTTLGIAAPAAEATVGEGSEESTLLDAGAAWVRWRDLGSHGILHGPAWRGIDRYGRRPRTGGLHRNSIAEIIKRRAQAAGLEDAALWGGHSLRRGFATEAIAGGVPERDVQRHGRWRSRASMDPYIDVSPGPCESSQRATDRGVATGAGIDGAAPAWPAGRLLRGTSGPCPARRMRRTASGPRSGPHGPAPFNGPSRVACSMASDAGPLSRGSDSRSAKRHLPDLEAGGRGSGLAIRWSARF